MREHPIIQAGNQAGAAGPRFTLLPSLSRRSWCCWGELGSIRTCTPMAMARCGPRLMRSKRCGKKLEGRTSARRLLDELVSPADFPRFRALDTMPVLSFQWEKPAGDTIGLT